MFPRRLLLFFIHSLPSSMHLDGLNPSSSTPLSSLVTNFYCHFPPLSFHLLHHDCSVGYDSEKPCCLSCTLFNSYALLFPCLLPSHFEPIPSHSRVTTPLTSIPVQSMPSFVTRNRKLTPTEVERSTANADTIILPSSEPCPTIQYQADDCPLRTSELFPLLCGSSSSVRSTKDQRQVRKRMMRSLLLAFLLHCTIHEDIPRLDLIMVTARLPAQPQG